MVAFDSLADGQNQTNHVILSTLIDECLCAIVWIMVCKLTWSSMTLFTISGSIMISRLKTLSLGWVVALIFITALVFTRTIGVC